MTRRRTLRVPSRGTLWALLTVTLGGCAETVGPDGRLDAAVLDARGVVADTRVDAGDPGDGGTTPGSDARADVTVDRDGAAEPCALACLRAVIEGCVPEGACQGELHDGGGRACFENGVRVASRSSTTPPVIEYAFSRAGRACYRIEVVDGVGTPTVSLRVFDSRGERAAVVTTRSDGTSRVECGGALHELDAARTRCSLPPVRYPSCAAGACP